VKTLQDIENEILELTTTIESNYPELYTLLDENPITIPSKKHPKMNISILVDYLESLKQILKQYTKTHRKL
jgi:hypothetical protein